MVKARADRLGVPRLPRRKVWEPGRARPSPPSVGGDGKPPAGHLDELGVLTPELAGDLLGGAAGFERSAAGKDVDGGVGELGPGVDADVGLGNRDDAGDALRRKLVEVVGEYRDAQSRGRR